VADDPKLITAEHPTPRRRVVLTGGPGGGKTTAADLLRRELDGLVVLVPESATILFEGGFPHVSDPDVQRAAQRAIFQVQTNLEDVMRSLYPDRTMVCDRGTVDGAGYWPDSRGGADGFFGELGTSLETEFSRYDVVVFFETAAAGGRSILGGNRHRIESTDEAVDLDRRLHAVWSKHPSFHFISHQESFLAKMQMALDLLQEVVLHDVAGDEGATGPGVADGLGADAG